MKRAGISLHPNESLAEFDRIWAIAKAFNVTWVLYLVPPWGIISVALMLIPKMPLWIVLSASVPFFLFLFILTMIKAFQVGHVLKLLGKLGGQPNVLTHLNDEIKDAAVFQYIAKDLDLFNAIAAYQDVVYNFMGGLMLALLNRVDPNTVGELTKPQLQVLHTFVQNDVLGSNYGNVPRTKRQKRVVSTFRVSAIRALPYLGNSTSLPVLQKIASDESNEEVRNTARTALQQLQSKLGQSGCSEGLV